LSATGENWDLQSATARAIGYRKTGNRLVPILHTKMALLGEVWWHDEDGLGGVADVTGFRSQRLWVSSANGTASSRGDLECGFWIHDPALLREAQRFLVGLLRHSEDFDPDADDLEPGLAEPAYDDAAFAEALATSPDWDDCEDGSDELPRRLSVVREPALAGHAAATEGSLFHTDSWG
jgi:hypothetical protein